MATFAVIKIILAEGALIVVAGRAGLRARLREMLRRESCCHLLAFWKSAPPDRVASFAVQILARAVIRMTEANGVRARRRRDGNGASRRVTSPARGDVRAARLPARRVALITGPVRVQIIWKRSRDTTACRGMTGDATRLRSRFRSTGHVLRVVVLGVEAGQSAGKSFDRRILLTQSFGRVTDGAERSARRIELRLMATDASLVSGQARLD